MHDDNDSRPAATSEHIGIAREQRLGRAHLGARGQLALRQAVRAVLGELLFRKVLFRTARAEGALVHLAAQAESHWHAALAGTLASNAMLVEGSQTAIWVVGTCLRAVDACFALAGSDALYEPSSLQRRMRDIHVAAQHNLMQPRQAAPVIAAIKQACREPYAIGAAFL